MRWFDTIRSLSLSKARAVIELVEMPSPQRKTKTVPEPVDVLLTEGKKGGASFKAYALRGIFAFPR